MESKVFFQASHTYVRKGLHQAITLVILGCSLGCVAYYTALTMPSSFASVILWAATALAITMAATRVLEYGVYRYAQYRCERG